MDPIDEVFVLEGYAGCGKTTMIKVICDNIESILSTARLINPKLSVVDTPVFTATTNKAAEVFSEAIGQEVRTIHSVLGLRMQTGAGGKPELIPSSDGVKLWNTLLFVDEASYVDSKLLSYITRFTKDCKIVYIGDPAQLTSGGKTAPVFSAGFTTGKLTKVVRQAEGNPIIELATKFRQTVDSGEFFSFTPDGHHIQYLPRQEFNEVIKKEFCRDDWQHHHSKILAWTNKRVQDYNQALRELITGSPHFSVGDYAICNSFVSTGRKSIKTDEIVFISGIEPSECFGYPGSNVVVNGHSFFMPESLQVRKDALKRFKQIEDELSAATVHQSWIDLRHMFACTVNKSQGSTYDRVYIDLDDMKRAQSNPLARMLYVATSRARHQVVFTGDLV